MVPCSREWHYRNHVQFHLTPQGKLGLMGAGTKKVVEIRECHLPEVELWEAVSTLQFDPGMNFSRISLRQGAENSLMMVLESDSPEIPELDIEADLSVVHLTGNDPVVLAGDDHLVMQVGERPFRVSAGSFFQVNTGMAGKMVEHVLDHVPLPPGAMVVDAYCGVGLFSAFFAPRVQRLIGIEASPSACQDFVVNLDEYDHVELYEAPVEDVLPTLDIHPDLVLLDPPRAGMHPQAMDALVKLNPESIAYVSCDPATLARDASRLVREGYKLLDITPFDLFPQTYHIESISLFKK
jgi:23S rRNA (uracil1939-C5)-methyltransferase